MGAVVTSCIGPRGRVDYIDSSGLRLHAVIIRNNVTGGVFFVCSLVIYVCFDAPVCSGLLAGLVWPWTDRDLCRRAELLHILNQTFRLKSQFIFLYVCSTYTNHKFQARSVTLITRSYPQLLLDPLPHHRSS